MTDSTDILISFGIHHLLKAIFYAFFALIKIIVMIENLILILSNRL